MSNVLEIPRSKNYVFVFTRTVGLIQFHTYHTPEEIREKLIPNRTTMAYVEGADEASGKVDQWLETANDGQHEIIAVAVKSAASGRIAAPGTPMRPQI